MLGDMQERKLTGSVQLRRGKWHVVLNLYDQEGKRRPKWINTGLPERGNKKKAEALKEQYIAEYEAKLRATADHGTLFADYAVSWLDAKRPSVELSTWENYENVTRNHIVPYFKNKKMALGDVRPRDIKAYYTYKLTDGRKDHKKGGLSYETMKKHSSVLKLIFADAVELEEIDRNPADAVTIPRPKVEDKRENLEDAVFLNAEEADKVLAGFDGDILQPLLVVTLYYGLRRSEVLGLKWDAVSFEDDTLEIKHTVVKHKTIVRKDRTKSKASHGVFMLLPEVKEILLELRKEQERNRKLFGKNYQDSDYIFTWPNGRQFRPDYLTKRFQTVLGEVGLPRMRFHDLRHSCSSILYDKGWNVKDIQEWLRHSKLETTMNIYTHISDQRKKILAKDMSGTFRTCKVFRPNKNQHPKGRGEKKGAEQQPLPPC